MKILNLTEDSEVYTSNAWLLSCEEGGTGCNTLIDTGCDPRILFHLRDIKRTSGASPIDQIILTHGHYDHSKMVVPIKKEFDIPIYAWSPYTAGVDEIITDLQTIQAGPKTLEILYIPGHTTDSVCVFCIEDGVLFSGDTPLFIWGTDATYEPTFVKAFERLIERKIHAIYPGHGDPVTSNVPDTLRHSFENLKKSRII